MAEKVANALVRREADAYRAQGLQEEALALLRKALAVSPPLPAGAKAAIEQQIQQIEAELGGASFDEGQQLSEEQIAVIRRGWWDDATMEELAVSADALRGLGFYEDALLEFRKAIQKGYSPHRVIEPMADCLVRLHEPRHVIDVLDGWAAEMIQSNKERFNITLSLAEQMWKTGNGEHAAAIARHLSEFKGVPKEYRMRLDALLKNSRSTKAPRKPLPNSETETPFEPSRFLSISEWIRKVFTSFKVKR